MLSMHFDHIFFEVMHVWQFGQVKTTQFSCCMKEKTSPGVIPELMQGKWVSSIDDYVELSGSHISIPNASLIGLVASVVFDSPLSSLHNYFEVFISTTS